MNKTILRLSRSARSRMPVLRALRIFGALIGLAAITTQVFSATNDLTSTLQKALFEEEVNRNPDAAIAAYQSLVAQVDRDRQVAATAIFRLGECYRKLGRSNDATAQYERIVRDFSDQQSLAILSRQNLAGLGAGSARVALSDLSTASSLSASGRARQRSLLQEEIKLVESNLAEQRKRVDVGIVPAADLLPIQRELLALKRQLAALEDTPVDLLKAGTGAESGIDDEEKEVRRIQAMIRNSPDLINGSGNNVPLVSAAADGQVRVVTYLLDHGADINRTAGGKTPLIAATIAGQNAVIELLISRGANLNAKDSDGYTALHFAVLNDFRTVTQTLLAHQPDVNARNNPDPGQQTPLHLAVDRGNAQLVDLLLAKGASPDITNANGATAVHLAVRREHLKILRQLLDAKASISVRDKAGNTPLHLAARSQQPDILTELLKRGAPVDARNNDDATPLFLAVNDGKRTAVKSLLDQKANPNLPAMNNPRGRPLYFNLSRTDDDEILALLLDHGADPEELDNQSFTSPLFRAVWANYPKGVQLLLQHKADPNRKASDGITALHFAANFGNAAIAKLLVAAGADVNARDNYGNTPLHKAVWKDRELRGPSPLPGVDMTAREAMLKGIEEFIAFLLDHKANPNLQNQQGNTPLDDADSRQVPGDLMASTPGRRMSPSSGAARTERGPSSRTEGGERTKLASLLIEHGAQANLPKPDRIEVRRPATGVAVMVFSKSTNNWNQFTLFDTLVNLFRTPFFMVDGNRRIDPRQTFTFSDLTRVAIVHHGPGTNVTRKEINLFNGPNQIDCTRDVPLDFGDVVEIPERLHALDQASEGITDEEWNGLMSCFNDWTVKLVAGKREATCEIHLPRPDTCLIGSVLGSAEARKILFSSSDLSRVKVTRRDPATGKAREWILDCTNPSQLPDLWLRNGDVVEVPEKQ